MRLYLDLGKLGKSMLASYYKFKRLGLGILIELKHLCLLVVIIDIKGFLLMEAIRGNKRNLKFKRMRR